MHNPTKRTYDDFNTVYDFFNKRLFGGQLPRCLITMQRKNKTYGYFAKDRFGTVDDQEITDEIALNPAHFRERGTDAVLSTLVHEMVHLWQFHFGKPSQSGYHNKEWARKMKHVGLIPSHTGQRGGKETGQKMTHYIDEDGPFARACAELAKRGFVGPYVDRWSDQKAQKKKAASKTKYTCPDCGLNAWAKPDISLLCGDCKVRLEPEESSL